MERKAAVAAVVGPTATGKTALGIGLAKIFGGEIVSCDSMQVYRGLPIGTAQPTAEELSAVPHHLISFLDVTEPFSVSDYVSLASRTIDDIHSRGKLPILVGGTGLYARSLLRGFSFEENCTSVSLREVLFRRAEEEGPETLYRELTELDPTAAGEIHPNNVKRVIRALEYCLLSGEKFSAQAERSKSAVPPYRFFLLCLSYRDRETLYRRIDSRVDKMLEAGLLEEAESFFALCEKSGMPPTAAQAIGYKELFPFFRGEISLKAAVENVKRESRRYAKRQLTWFSHEPDARFFHVDDYDSGEALLDAAAHALQAFLSEGEGEP